MSESMSRRPRIAMYISSMNRGGAEHVMANLAEHFVGKGYDVILVTTYKAENEYALCGRNTADYSADEKKDENGIVSVNICGTALTRYYSEIDSPDKGSRISNFRARCDRLTYIWKITKPDVILSFIGKNNMMAVKTASRLGIPVAVSIRAEPRLEYPNLPMELAARHYYSKASLVIMQTDSTCGFFGRRIGKKTVSLKNPIDEKFLTGSLMPMNQRDRTIVVVGRCDENKRHEMIIDAFTSLHAKMPDYNLVIYGDGELHSRLTDKVRNTGMKSYISLPGICGADEIADKMGRSSIFILASDSEGMPNSLIEAMCMGMACISTDCPCGGPKMLINDGVNGTLIGVGDEDALQSALLNLADNDDETKPQIPHILLVLSGCDHSSFMSLSNLSLYSQKSLHSESMESIMTAYFSLTI